MDAHELQFPKDPDRVLVKMCILFQVAIDAAAARAEDPTAFPGLPADGLAGHFARKTLAWLIEADMIPASYARAFLTPTPWEGD